MAGRLLTDRFIDAGPGVKPNGSVQLRKELFPDGAFWLFDKTLSGLDTGNGLLEKQYTDSGEFVADYLDFGDGTILEASDAAIDGGSGSFTAGIHVKHLTTGSFQQILGSLATSGSGGWQLGARESGSVWRFFVNGQFDAILDFTLTAGDGNYHYLVGSYDEPSKTAYFSVDGAAPQSGGVGAFRTADTGILRFNSYTNSDTSTYTELMHMKSAFFLKGVARRDVDAVCRDFYQFVEPAEPSLRMVTIAPPAGGQAHDEYYKTLLAGGML